MASTGALASFVVCQSLLNQLKQNTHLIGEDVFLGLSGDAGKTAHGEGSNPEDTEPQ